MPTLYKLRPLTPEECEVKGAIAALDECGVQPTFDQIVAFTNLPKSRLQRILKGLRECGAVQAVRE